MVYSTNTGQFYKDGTCGELLKVFRKGTAFLVTPKPAAVMGKQPHYILSMSDPSQVEVLAPVKSLLSFSKVSKSSPSETCSKILFLLLPLSDGSFRHFQTFLFS